MHDTSPPPPPHPHTSPPGVGTRGVYPIALPKQLCQELLFIQRSLAVVGYRPCVTSLTLHEIVQTCPQLLPCLATARQLIWDVVEELFDLPCQVWPETTSLISWSAGASIGWHYDANRCEVLGTVSLTRLLLHHPGKIVCAGEAQIRRQVYGIVWPVVCVCVINCRPYLSARHFSAVAYLNTQVIGQLVASCLASCPGRPHTTTQEVLYRM